MATPIEQGKQIVSTIVDSTIHKLATGEFPNALRGISHAANEIKSALVREKLNPDDFIMAGTIGDIDPRLSSQDHIEKKRFGHLESDLLLDASSELFLEGQRIERELLLDYKKRGINIFGYDSQARGTAESRELIRMEGSAMGIETTSIDDVWLTDGGMGALARTFRALHTMIRGRDGTLLSPEVCFPMATSCATDHGLKVELVKTGDMPGQQINGYAIKRYFAEGGHTPDIVLLTPAENPTAKSYEPQNLREVLTLLKQKNPDVIFIFDMAYMAMIPQKRSGELLRVIKETGAYSQSIFALSESKHFAEPALRFGAAIIPENKSLQTAFQNDTIRNYSSFGWKTDVWFQVLNKVVTPGVLADYTLLLRTRQYALLEVLRDLDPTHKYFKNLESLSIPGFHEEGDGTIEMDNPLYLYIELQEGISALVNVAKDLGIFGVPGSVFGDQHNHMRFSLGVVSLEQILKRSPQTMDRLKNQLFSS
ncbi:MAG: aminotransferase class I/II-fold pyridoxal phosphate-dependent enzyme [bacterium]